MYLSQIAKCICLKIAKWICLKVQNVFVSNFKMNLSQIVKCICLKLQNVLDHSQSVWPGSQVPNPRKWKVKIGESKFYEVPRVLLMKRQTQTPDSWPQGPSVCLEPSQRCRDSTRVPVEGHFRYLVMNIQWAVPSFHFLADDYDWQVIHTRMTKATNR